MNIYIKKSQLLISIFLITLFYACDQKTTVNLGSPQRRLVVEGRIELGEASTTNIQVIELSSIGGFFKNEETPRASGADVWITNAQNERFIFEEEEEGRYVNHSLVGELNETYVLHIIWDGQEYEAIESMIAVSPIESIYQRFEKGNLFEDEGIKIAIDFVDPENVENFYFWETYLDGELQILPDPGNKNNLIAKDEFFDGSRIEGYFPNEETVFEEGSQVVVKQMGLSENAYNYYFSLFDQAGKSGSLIDTPPIPVRGNIRNLTDPNKYALGYFYASQIAEGHHTVD
ncbi:MAG: DUF4249 domain-containing protein [Cyclobacteriaceae bacterium]